MPHTAIHWTQAEHNQELARSLLTAPNHDWAITIGFYSAIHFFESWLFYKTEKHSEVSIPPNVRSVHTWREKLVQKYLPRDSAKAYRKLRSASETSRYLSSPSGVPGAGSLTNTAFNYFNPGDAKKLVEGDLGHLSSRLQWWVFVERLGLSDRSAGEQQVYKKLCNEFISQAAFMACRSDRLLVIFSRTEVTILHDAITSIGVSHSEVVAAALRN